MRVLSLDKYQIFFRRRAISFLQLLAMRDEATEATEKIHWIQSDSFHYNHLCLDFLSVLAAFVVFGVHFGAYTAKAKEAQDELRRYFNSRTISFFKIMTPSAIFCRLFICSSYIRKNIVFILKKKNPFFTNTFGVIANDNQYFRFSAQLQSHVCLHIRHHLFLPQDVSSGRLWGHP